MVLAGGRRICGAASLSSLWGPMADQPHANQNTKPSSCVEKRAFLVRFGPQREYTFYEPGLPLFPITGGGLFFLLLLYPSGVEFSFLG